MRWGATEFFNQHFKYVAQDAGLRRALIKDLNDPAAAVRVNAARGLWQWSYWSADDEAARNNILEALVTRMNTETDPTTRRAVHEAIYATLMKHRLPGSLDKRRRNDAGSNAHREGYEAVVHDQAQVLAKALRSATPLDGREFSTRCGIFTYGTTRCPSSKRARSQWRCQRYSQSMFRVYRIFTFQAMIISHIATRRIFATTCITGSTRRASAMIAT